MKDQKQAFLEMLAFRGVERFAGTDVDGRVIAKRLSHELAVIEQAGFASYFLIVWDIMRFCREQGIPTGPGRGSVCGSLVAFCTYITDVDPLRWDIPFERFLNLDRIAQPDVDLDICAVRREEVIDYLKRTYNKSEDPLLTSVAQIATFGTLMAKGVVRDVCRILNVDQLLHGVHANETGDKLAKMIPEGSGADQIGLREWVETDDAKAFKEYMSRLDHAYLHKRGVSVWQTCLRIEGIRRHSSSHAAGVVIADRPLVEVVPLSKRNKDADIAIQYDMRDAEEVGLLKMDVLGLRTVTVIGEIETLVRRHEPGFRVLDVPLDDPDTFTLLADGDVLGVFQLEGQGITAALKGIEPDDFEDIIALLALYRPGPMEQIGSYARRKLGKEDVVYLLPELEQALSKTYGLIVYQEQVMAISQLVAGFTGGEADYFRKAVGKKDIALIEEQIEKFKYQALDLQHDPKIVDELARQLLFFGRYGFNRGHATGYAFITYWTAYLKAHYPAEFYTATLNSFIGDTGRLGEFILDAGHHDIEIRCPDINRSGRGFTLSEDGAILFGLEAVKGIGTTAALDIIEERDATEKTQYKRVPVTRTKDDTGVEYKTNIVQPVRVPNEPRPFDGLWDFCKRLTHIPVNAKQALVEAGAFAYDYDERQALLNVCKAVNEAAKKGKQYVVPEATADRVTLMRREKDVLGFYLTSHPLDEYRADVERYGAVVDGDYDRMRKQVCIAGLVMTIKTNPSKRGEMAWLTLETGITGLPRITAFNEAWGPASGEITVGDVVVITGRKDEHPKFGASIMADTILKVRKDAPEARERVLIALPDTDIGELMVVRGGCVDRGQSLDLIVEDSGRYALIACAARVLPTGGWVDLVEEGSGFIRFDVSRRGPFPWIHGSLRRKEGHLSGSGRGRVGVQDLPVVSVALDIFGGKVLAELEVDDD